VAGFSILSWLGKPECKWWRGPESNWGHEDFQSENAAEAFEVKFQPVDSLSSLASTFGFVRFHFEEFDLDGHILGTIHIDQKAMHSNGQHWFWNRER